MKKRTKYFKYDLEKYYNGLGGSSNPKFLRKMKIWFTSFEVHCIIILRINERLHIKYINSNNKLRRFMLRSIQLILWKQSEFFHHVCIMPDMEVGPGFIIMHASTIYVGAKRIGKNCTIYQNTTIGGGAMRHDVNQPKPEIGDDVWIGPNSIITGDIQIGNNVTISAGTVLSKNVPDNCLVAGNPGRIIIQNYNKPIETNNNENSKEADSN